jgi:hypothetical protein
VANPHRFPSFLSAAVSGKQPREIILSATGDRINQKEMLTNLGDGDYAVPVK